jgi:hypothetical protein
MSHLHAALEEIEHIAADAQCWKALKWHVPHVGAPCDAHTEHMCADQKVQYLRALEGLDSIERALGQGL